MHDKRKKKHKWWIKSRTKTKEEKGTHKKILIEIKKKNYEKCPFSLALKKIQVN